MSNKTIPTFTEWIESTQEPDTVPVSISKKVIFADRKTLSRLFVEYCVYLLDNGCPMPEYPDYFDRWEEEEEDDIEGVSPTTTIKASSSGHFELSSGGKEMVDASASASQIPDDGGEFGEILDEREEQDLDGEIEDYSTYSSRSFSSYLSPTISSHPRSSLPNSNSNPTTPSTQSTIHQAPTPNLHAIHLARLLVTMANILHTLSTSPEFTHINTSNLISRLRESLEELSEVGDRVPTEEILEMEEECREFEEGDRMRWVGVRINELAVEGNEGVVVQVGGWGER